MFRAKYLIPLLLFAAYLLLEAGYLAGKRIAPDYPDVKAVDLSEAISVTSGRTVYQFYPLDIPEGGTIHANFFGTLKGKAEKLPKMYFGIFSEAEKETLLSPDTSPLHFRKALEKSSAMEHITFQRRRNLKAQKKISQGGRYYLIVANLPPTVLKGERVFYFLTNLKAKAKCFWPYALILPRNLVIACLVLFFAFCLYPKFGRAWRFAVAFTACGLLAFIVSATPHNVLNAAVHGPKSKVMLRQKVEKELRDSETVLKLPLRDCAPYAAGFIRIKGRPLDPASPSLVYTDLYKAFLYDDPHTENLMCFFGKGSSEKVFVFDTVHSFFDEVALRFWHEGRGGAALIESVYLVNVKLPPVILQALLGISQFFLPCFWVLWAAFLLTFCFLLVYARRDIYSKAATFALAVVSLSVLVAPVYSLASEEPLFPTTSDRWIMGLRPMSFYALLWHNEPGPGVNVEELEAPNAGSLTVASFNDHVLAGRSELYPDDSDTFQRFFTRFFSNVRMNVRREMVELKGLRLVRLSSAYLMMRIVAWIWLVSLILGSLYHAVSLIFRREKA
ncbi:hypothetical protein IKZ40_04695 [bacterium]|nr:hypothetical protein [bacterium]